MGKVDISVIIPTYKPKNYIWECLNSLASQSFNKNSFEVIIILNGCKEPWKEQIETFITDKLSELNVILLQTDIPGVSNARNLGLDAAKGEYVAFIDDDDYVSPNYLSGLYSKVGDKTISLAYPYAFEDGAVRKLPYRMTEEYNNLAGRSDLPFYKARRYFSGPCMKLIPRRCIGENRFDSRLANGEDTLFMFSISNKIIYVDFAGTDCIYYRRFRSESATTSNRKFMKRLKSNAIQLLEYTRLYLTHPRDYNFNFYITRCGGCILGSFRT